MTPGGLHGLNSARGPQTKWSEVSATSDAKQLPSCLRQLSIETKQSTYLPTLPETIKKKVVHFFLTLRWLAAEKRELEVVIGHCVFPTFLQEQDGQEVK